MTTTIKIRGEFEFQPTKTYATMENARAAIAKVLAEGDMFMIVGVPGSMRYAPVVTAAQHPARYAHLGFTVTGWRS